MSTIIPPCYLHPLGNPGSGFCYLLPDNPLYGLIHVLLPASIPPSVVSQKELSQVLDLIEQPMGI